MTTKNHADQASLSSLRALALAATPGPWRAQQRNKQEAIYIVGPDCTPPACHAFYADNAAYIAAANPATVLALIERLRKAEAVRQITSGQKRQNRERLQAEIAAGRVHADADVEQKWAERERDQNCPACGGSGHVDDATSSAAMDVLAERRRQIEVKGWTPEHDDSHNHGELAHAAGVLALADIKLFLRGAIEYWPWDAPSMEADIIGTSCRTRLIKAAALLLAEIERLDRATSKKSEARHD